MQNDDNYQGDKQGGAGDKVGDENENAMKKLEEQEKEQKEKLNEMKREEYHWYKIKMIGAAILVPIVYLIFFLLMKYT